jgi:hypothetical protein
MPATSNLAIDTSHDTLRDPEEGGAALEGAREDEAITLVFRRPAISGRTSAGEATRPEPLDQPALRVALLTLVVGALTLACAFAGTL